MKIYLLRHVETEANVNPEKPAIITQKGKEQMKKLAQEVSQIKVDAIITSDLERAKITAKEIAATHRQRHEIEITRDLREIYRVIVGGAIKEGSRPNRYEEDLARAQQAWTTLINRNEDTIIVVTHGNLIRFFISKIQNIPPEQTKDITIDTASITIVEITPSKQELLLLNETEYLHEKPVKKNFYAE